jgi:hypothetical protein
MLASQHGGTVNCTSKTACCSRCDDAMKRLRGRVVTARFNALTL